MLLFFRFQTEPSAFMTIFRCAFTMCKFSVLTGRRHCYRFVLSRVLLLIFFLSLCRLLWYVCVVQNATKHIVPLLDLDFSFDMCISAFFCDLPTRSRSFCSLNIVFYSRCLSFWWRILWTPPTMFVPFGCCTLCTKTGAIYFIEKRIKWTAPGANEKRAKKKLTRTNRM